MRVAIRTPDQPDINLELQSGEGILVGRQPDPDKASLAHDADASGALRRVTIPSANVSANHLLITDGDVTSRVVDLGSRNGTWLRLPPLAEIGLPNTEEMSLFLALPAAGGEPIDHLPDAAWTGAEDYGRAVSDAIETWLRSRDTPARITTRRKEDTGDTDRIGRIPLATDVDLEILPLRTLEADWLRVLAQVERYVRRQNVLFAAEEEMRDAGLIVVSPAMRQTVARVVEAASGGARTLLLIGPSGSGKEGLARCFHRNTRRAGAFVAKNCGLFSREFARCELFGAERGAFTGCVQRIIGAVEAAHEGTVFLDEIGELPLSVQAMLLRFLDHGEYERMGQGGRPNTADVRLVCATNKDLRAAALKTDFRPDLWFRLSIHVVEVPPLRDRFEDIRAYLEGREMPEGGSLYERFRTDALELIREHRWDGNFRELINFAERLASAPSRDVIDGDACQRALEEGALHPLHRSLSAPAKPVEVVRSDAWLQLAERAAKAFVEDHETPAPRTWDEVKQYIEGYLKPVLLAHLSGADRFQRREEVDLRAAAEQLRADRGTAAKQIDRYFDRFAK